MLGNLGPTYWGRKSRRGNARHSLKHVATRLPPAGPHTDIQCCNRRRHNNRSNRQRRLEDTANDQLVKGKSPQRPRVAVQIEQYLLCSAAQLTSFSSPAATASRLTSSMLPHASLMCRRRKPAAETCADNTAKLRPQASALTPRPCTCKAQRAAPRAAACAP